MRIRFTILFLFLCFALQTFAQDIPTPKSHFGFDIGDDYQLANFTQTEAYFKKVAEASDRVQMVEIGKTEYGRSQPMMIVTAPQNFEMLGRYKKISQTLAHAEITKEEAERLSVEGKPVVWIDGGLHANEVVGPHQLIETLYQLASREDAETLAILDNVIVLLVHANPDGMEIMSDWYMRKEDPAKRDQNIPILYQKYVGHDNNRDFYMNNMSEAANMSLQQYVEWIPQIIYNHHQTGPAGTVVAGPPYRDPFNHVFDPLIITSLDAVGAAMINRMHQEDKPGYTRLDGSVFSTWWNGGLRTTPYYHNIIGILTEIIGNPTPGKVPLVPDRLIPDNATPYPVTPQDWHFKQSIDYSVSLNYAILNHAVRHGDELLYNIWLMGKKSIDKGSRDYVTMYPKYAQAVKDAYADAQNGNSSSSRRGLPSEYYDSIYSAPANRDPRGYILSADQPDFPTAVKFMNALIKSGILVEKASAEFTVNGKTYPANSFIVKTAQAFRPHVIDMFEPQDHPNDFQYPGGPPVRPYDAAGWTLALQMGVEFDRLYEGFDGPFERIPYGEIQAPPAKPLSSSSGYLLDVRNNNSFMAVNDLLKANVKVYRISTMSDGLPAGSFYVSNAGKKELEIASQEYGVYPVPVRNMPKGSDEIKPARIGLYDYYGGSMPSGWVRWMLEQFHFDFQLVFPQEIDAGGLNEKYDVLLFISSGIPGVGSRGYSRSQPDAEEIDEQYHHMLGGFTVDTSVPQIEEFIQNGGEVITVGSATALAYHLDLPVADALTEIAPDGSIKPLSGEKYYVPGSVLEMQVDNSVSINYGMGDSAYIMFNRSPVFKLAPSAANSGVKAIAWFGEEEPLRSGWAWGQSYLKNGVTAFEAQLGKGKFYAFGPEITFRAQSHGTFKMLFNGLYR
ncbi:M14 family metallopeptidase [Algoriphagus halophytocola]|uniref:M14 family metallopeptidase n=2 Tax=Algoriphagus halophytocola TaxID=2991499 RepID=A0ABY6MLY8_9BACT|nr:MULTISPECIES: M14 metallopeptidase family protein [unclassified Algoriphagus]UZD24792.1 M14 family metallopeptidase [Algoriphagus sp. TR-M5]WBL45099.1 M14 family metallopeptidase [Algoriphagus sp. TR-M9]